MMRTATTSNGSLRLTLDYVPNPRDNHDLSYKSGMVSSFLTSGDVPSPADSLCADSIMV